LTQNKLPVNTQSYAHAGGDCLEFLELQKIEEEISQMGDGRTYNRWPHVVRCGATVQARCAKLRDRQAKLF